MSEGMLILLAGDYKTGKTVSAGTFPKPALMLDYDNGFSSIKNAKGKDGKLIVPDHDKIDVVNFIRETFSDLDFKTPSKDSGKVAPKHTAESAEFITKHNLVMKALNTDGCYNGKGPYQTLIIDSLTSMFRVWKETILHMNRVPALRIQDYGTLENLLYGQFIPALKAINKKIPYIILVDHIMMDKDEISGRIMEFPVGPSQNMGKGMGKEIDEIWKMEIKGDGRVWRTRKSGLFQAGSRLHLPDPIEPATYTRLKEVTDAKN